LRLSLYTHVVFDSICEPQSSVEPDKADADYHIKLLWKCGMNTENINIKCLKLTLAVNTWSS